MKRCILFLICLLALTMPASAYYLGLSCPESVQAGQVIKCSVDSNFPAGTMFYLELYPFPSYPPYLDRQQVFILENHATQYRLFATNGLDVGTYQIMPRLGNDDGSKLSSDSVINQTVRIIAATPSPTSTKIPAPLINDITPSSAALGGTVTMTISGTGFVNGATVKMVQAGYPAVNATGAYVSPTSITCTFNLRSLQNGYVNVMVTNPDGQYSILQNQFMIRNASETTMTIPATSTVTSSPITTVATSIPSTAIPTTSQTTITTTPKPTATVNYSATIAAMQSQIAEQGAKITEQGNVLDQIMTFLRTVFGWK